MNNMQVKIIKHQIFMNIFFKVKQSTFDKTKFKKRFIEYAKSSKYGFFNGPKRKIDLNFFIHENQRTAFSFEVVIFKFFSYKPL